MGNFVHTQLETCHYNDGAVAFYAYFTAPPTRMDWQEAQEWAAQGSEPLGLITPDKWVQAAELPTPLSRRAGLRRYYLGGAG